MTVMTTYDIHMEPKYGPLERIESAKLVAENKEPWWNQTLCRVNDSLARIGVFHGAFHWHKHDVEDELFYVLDGKLLLDIEDPRSGVRSTVELSPREGMMVPRGVVHRTRAKEKTTVLMVEAATIVPTGDASGG
jgi:mannose-6-phosphate isomerase-like protein (cupin superfamily)